MRTSACQLALLLSLGMFGSCEKKAPVDHFKSCPSDQYVCYPPGQEPMCPREQCAKLAAKQVEGLQISQLSSHTSSVKLYDAYKRYDTAHRFYKAAGPPPPEQFMARKREIDRLIELRYEKLVWDVNHSENYCRSMNGFCRKMEKSLDQLNEVQDSNSRFQWFRRRQIERMNQ